MQVLKSLYVDDYVGCAYRETSSFENYGQLKSCFQDGGLNLRKCIWVTNSANVQVLYGEDVESPNAIQEE